MATERIPVAADPEGPYWAAAARGELAYLACEDCGKALIYAKQYCPGCTGSNLTWQKATGRGTVYSYSVVHRAPSPNVQHEVPYVQALVDLEEGIRRMSWIVDCPPEAVQIGMAVQVVFREQDGRAVPFFTPSLGGQGGGV